MSPTRTIRTSSGTVPSVTRARSSRRTSGMTRTTSRTGTSRGRSSQNTASSSSHAATRPTATRRDPAQIHGVHHRATRTFIESRFGTIPQWPIRVRPVCSGPDVPPRRPPPQAIRHRRRARRPRVRGPARAGVRVPRRERRGQDDDDADHARRARAGRRRGALARGGEPQAAALDVGLPPRGARPVPADAGDGAARVLRRAPRRPRGAREARGDRPGCAGSGRRTSRAARPSSSRRATSRRSSSSPRSSTTRR